MLPLLCEELASVSEEKYFEDYETRRGKSSNYEINLNSKIKLYVFYPVQNFSSIHPTITISNNPKSLNLVKAKVYEAEANDIEDEDDKEALELEADEGEMLNCIIQ